MVSFFMLIFFFCPFYFTDAHLTDDQLYEFDDFGGDHDLKSDQKVDIDSVNKETLNWLFGWCNIEENTLQPYLIRNYVSPREWPRYGIGYKEFNGVKRLIIYFAGTDFDNEFDATNLINTRMIDIRMNGWSSKKEKDIYLFPMTVHKGFTDAFNGAPFIEIFFEHLGTILEQILEPEKESKVPLYGYKGTLLIDEILFIGHSQGAAIASNLFMQYVGHVNNAFNRKLNQDINSWFNHANVQQFEALLNKAKVITFGGAAFVESKTVTNIITSLHKKKNYMVAVHFDIKEIKRIWETITKQITNYVAPKDGGPLLFSGTMDEILVNRWWKERKSKWKYEGSVAEINFMRDNYIHWAGFAGIGAYRTIKEKQVYDLTDADIKTHIWKGAKILKSVSSTGIKILWNMQFHHGIAKYIGLIQAVIDEESKPMAMVAWYDDYMNDDIDIDQRGRGRKDSTQLFSMEIMEIYSLIAILILMVIGLCFAFICGGTMGWIMAK